MELGKILAANIRQYKLARQLSVAELAEELHLAASTTQEYLKGTGNPRADTIDMLAQRMGTTVAELIVSPPSGAAQAVGMARELAALPPGKRARGLELIRELAELFAGEE